MDPTDPTVPMDPTDIPDAFGVFGVESSFRLGEENDADCVPSRSVFPTLPPASTFIECIEFIEFIEIIEFTDPCEFVEFCEFCEFKTCAAFAFFASCASLLAPSNSLHAFQRRFTFFNRNEAICVSAPFDSPPFH